MEGPAPMFYSNFEVVDVAFFHRSTVRAYTNAVLKSGGIYRHRWGDAIIRYGQLRVGNGRALCFDGAYGYCHGHCCMAGVGPCSYPGGGCWGYDADGAHLELVSFNETHAG